jgi:pimeloyl-ACP methyl ester carboxylesterase
MAAEEQAVVRWEPTPAQWRSLMCPALVLEGDRTVGWLREVAAIVARRLPHGALQTLRGLDHLAPVEAPEVVAATIRAFITGQTSEAGAGCSRRADGG